MKPLPHAIITLLLCLAASLPYRSIKAQTTTPEREDLPFVTEDNLDQQNTLQSLVRDIYQLTQQHANRSLEIGRLDIHAYTYGTSQCFKQSFIGRLFPHLLPFQSSTDNKLGFEAFSQIDYQWPGDLQFSTISLGANNLRRGQKVMKELYKAILPSYSLERRGERGIKKTFVLPFYDDRMRQYSYRFLSTDSLLQEARQNGLTPDTSHLCRIAFTPRHPHHNLLEGSVLVDSVTKQLVAMQCQGHIDLASFTGTFFQRPDSSDAQRMMPYSSHLDIDYNYLGTHSRNSYHTLYRFITQVPLDSLKHRNTSYDLTRFYTEPPSLADELSVLRPCPLPPSIDSLIHQPSAKSPKPRSVRLDPRLETLGETLVDGTQWGSDGNRLRIYGPFDPASFGYDKFNGVTIRERGRYNRLFHDGSMLHLRGEIGYAFRLKELRWRLYGDWTYNPSRRGHFHLEARRSNSTFSSRFIETVNEALKQDRDKVNFDSLGIDYYQRYEIDFRHSIELTNGLMLHTGILQTHRFPVKHGVRKATEERRDQIIDTRYGDFAPYLRLQYTPHQYYWYNNGYKEYIDSPSPTFSIEVARAIPGVFNAESNYGRFELDMQQLIRVSHTHYVAYRFSGGRFFNRKGEYFINYRYFARSQYPETWEDDRIGGAFHLLDDYWYSSSPSYAQVHLMHEDSFGLLHVIRPISRYIIKERTYWGLLLAGDKLYNELGYGIANNFFNVGLFVGFKNLDYYGIGVKFRIEIGNHL